jgi:twitching motility protein PilT
MSEENPEHYEELQDDYSEPQAESHGGGDGQLEMSNERVATLAHVDEYLRFGHDYDCSDIHLATASRPMWRRFGALQEIWPNAEILTAADCERLAMGFLGPREQKRLKERGDVDFAYVSDHGRYRASVVKQRLGYDMVFRIINTKVRTMTELGLPQSLKPLTQYHNGLVLVTGSVGSGKSTTLAALVNEINHERNDHRVLRRRPPRGAAGRPGRHHGGGNARP